MTHYFPFARHGLNISQCTKIHIYFVKLTGTTRYIDYVATLHWQTFDIWQVFRYTWTNGHQSNYVVVIFELSANCSSDEKYSDLRITGLGKSDMIDLNEVKN